MQPLISPEDFESLRALPVALVYKHSTRCPISSVAYHEMTVLCREHPDVPVYLVDVIASRPMARYVAERTGIEHHSPQVIMLVRGEPAWSVTHFDVRAHELTERVAAVAAH